MTEPTRAGAPTLPTGGGRMIVRRPAGLRRLRRLLRPLRMRAHGGSIAPYRPRGDEQMVVLSPGKAITDPEEAEALGMPANRTAEQ